MKWKTLRFTDLESSDITDHFGTKFVTFRPLIAKKNTPVPSFGFDPTFLIKFIRFISIVNKTPNYQSHYKYVERSCNMSEKVQSLYVCAL